MRTELHEGTETKRSGWVLVSTVRVEQKNPIHSLAHYEQKGLLQYLSAFCHTQLFNNCKLDCHIKIHDGKSILVSSAKALMRNLE